MSAGLVPWAINKGGRLHWFTLCPLHSAEVRAQQDGLNAELAPDGLRLVRFEIPEGAAVHVALPVGARCAECFGDPPCDAEPPPGPTPRGAA